MRKFFFIIVIFITGQNIYGQNFSVLEKKLKTEFPENSTEDGRWVFYPEEAKIERIEKPAVKAVIPNYEFYKVVLTNYLGYHINEATCLILFDSQKSKVILIAPLWYEGINEQLIKLFLKKPFESNEKLLSFFSELNELMETGSEYKFVNTSSNENQITYDLVYSKGDNYSTSGIGTKSTISYTKDGIWREIEIKIKDLKILEYTSINPAIKGQKEFENQYKETIK